MDQEQQYNVGILELSKYQTAKTLGILAIIFSVVCSPAGLVLAIIGLCKSSKKKMATGPLEKIRSTAHTLNLIGLIISIVFLVILIAYSILISIVFTALIQYFANNTTEQNVQDIFQMIQSFSDSYGID